MTTTLLMRVWRCDSYIAGWQSSMVATVCVLHRGMLDLTVNVLMELCRSLVCGIYC